MSGFDKVSKNIQKYDGQFFDIVACKVASVLPHTSSTARSGMMRPATTITVQGTMTRSTALWFGTDPLQHKYPEVGPYVFCHANPIMRIDLDGQADWKAILKGSLSVYGGYMAIESGVVLVVTPTVVSQAAGATLLSTGITAVGLGTTKIIAGLVDNGSASSIPTGVGETIGQSIDAVAGNVSSTGRTIGSIIDASFGFVSNALQGTSITLNDVIANFGVSIVDAIESITYGFQALLENNPLHIYKTDSSIKEDIVCPKDNLRVAD